MIGFSFVGKGFEQLDDFISTAIKRSEDLSPLRAEIGAIVQGDLNEIVKTGAKAIESGQLEGAGYVSKLLYPQNMRRTKNPRRTKEEKVNLVKLRQGLTEQSNDVANRVSIRRDTVDIKNDVYPTIELHEKLVSDINDKIINYIYQKDEK